MLIACALALAGGAAWVLDRDDGGTTRTFSVNSKLRTKKGSADYARRKAIVEPVFGQIQVAQHGDQLRLRGIVKADFETAFHHACHNFRKLLTSGWTPAQPALN